MRCMSNGNVNVCHKRSGARREHTDIELVVASLDTAYGENGTSDCDALMIWGVWVVRDEHSV